MQTVYTTAVLSTADRMWTVPPYAFPRGKLQHYKANEQRPGNTGFLLVYCFRYRRCFIVSILHPLPAFSLVHALLHGAEEPVLRKSLNKIPVLQTEIPTSNRYCLPRWNHDTGAVSNRFACGTRGKSNCHREILPAGRPAHWLGSYHQAASSLSEHAVG